MAYVVIYRRFSNDDQEVGDSLTRQERACAAFAAAKGWTTSETLTDKGRSAFTGEHLLPDADLGKFVQRAEAGKLPKGTVLLAERLDRLSRKPVGEAMAWLHGLTSKGVEIALADTGQTFAANPSIETFLGTAIRAAQNHEESAKKSERIRSAKQRLWHLAEQKEGKWTNLAARPPLWLKRNPDRDGWILDDERVKTIRDIYRWSADGLGAVAISKLLNSNGIKPFGIWRKYEQWGRSSVRQLLSNPAVEGDFLPEKGIFIGKILTGFYPRIVDADVVASARAGQKARKKASGKRSSTGTVNLFAGLTSCECGMRAFITSNTRKGKTYTYLRCEGSSEGRCDNIGYYPYAKFEDSALEICLDLALDDRFFEAEDGLKSAKIMAAEIEKLLSESRSKRSRLISIYSEGDDEVKSAIDDLQDEIANLKRKFSDATSEVERASGSVDAVEHLRRVKDIRAAARSDVADVRESARAKLRLAFAGIIQEVSIGMSPEGEKIFTIIFLGGILALKIDTKGRLVDSVSEAMGRELWTYLPPENQKLLQPIIRRIQDLDIGKRLKHMRDATDV